MKPSVPLVEIANNADALRVRRQTAKLVPGTPSITRNWAPSFS